MYPGYAAKITGPVGEWTAVESGDVIGYVKTEYILTGAEAQTYAENLVTEAQQEGKEEAEAFTVLLLSLVVFLELSELLLPRRITANIIKAIIIAAITAPIRSFLNGITTILV